MKALRNKQTGFDLLVTIEGTASEAVLIRRALQRLRAEYQEHLVYSTDHPDDHPDMVEYWTAEIDKIDAMLRKLAI